MDGERNRVKTQKNSTTVFLLTSELLSHILLFAYFRIYAIPYDIV